MSDPSTSIALRGILGFFKNSLLSKSAYHLLKECNERMSSLIVNSHTSYHAIYPNINDSLDEINLLVAELKNLGFVKEVNDSQDIINAVESCLCIPDDNDVLWDYVAFKYGFIDDNDMLDIQACRAKIGMTILELSKAKEELDANIESMISGTFKTINTDLRKYFLSRSLNKFKVPPRVTIKRFDVNTDQVSDLRRSGSLSDSELKNFNVKYHKPFSEMVDNNDSSDIVILNNLAEAVVEKGYKNKRIDNSKVFEKFSKKSGDLYVYFDPFVDGVFSKIQYGLKRIFTVDTLERRKFYEAWKKCFTDIDEEGAHDSSFYSSVAVAMISLKNVQQPEKLGIFISKDDDQNDIHKKLLYGFLCVDHPERGYFDSELDTPILRGAAILFQDVWHDCQSFTALNLNYNIASSIIESYNEGQLIGQGSHFDAAELDLIGMIVK